MYARRPLVLLLAGLLVATGVPAAQADDTAPAVPADAAAADVTPADDAAPADPPAVDASAVDPPPVDASAQPAQRSVLARKVDRRLHDRRLGGNVAMVVLDGATGAVLAAHRPDALMRPASNMKAVTAVAVLATMPAGTHLPTRVLAGPRPQDVILRGGGDPLLSRAQLRLLAARTAKAVRERGVSRVVLHLDLGLFAPRSRGPRWGPRYPSGLLSGIESLALYNDYSSRPSRNARAVFASALRARGIAVTVGKALAATPDAPTLAQVRGHTIGQAVGSMLSWSDSNIAEVLFRHIAIAAGQPATWKGAIGATHAALGSLGLDSSGQRIFDGSGLSEHDALTPRFLATMMRLVRIEQPDRFAAMFRAHAMPIGGRTGTMGPGYGRYDTAPSRCARGKVQAKTGTLHSIIALSGVARTNEHGLRTFSVMVNDRPGRFERLTTRRAVDGIAATVVGCW